jgi:LPXTG-motif cell wall-anchored protein
LGVSTGEVLGAATGSETYWLIMAIIMMAGGLFLINRKRFVK